MTPEKNTVSAYPENAPDLGYKPVPDIFKLPQGMNFGPCSSVAVTKTGNLLVFNRSARALMEFDGNVLGATGGQGKGPNRYGEAHFLALDRRQDIYVADTLNWRVQKLVKSK